MPAWSQGSLAGTYAPAGVFWPSSMILSGHFKARTASSFSCCWFHGGTGAHAAHAMASEARHFQVRVDIHFCCTVHFGIGSRNSPSCKGRIPCTALNSIRSWLNRGVLIAAGSRRRTCCGVCALKKLRDTIVYKKLTVFIQPPWEARTMDSKLRSKTSTLATVK